MRTALIVILVSLTAGADAGIYRTGGPATTDNDASCDISVLPAATLLLPYFEVDIASAAGTGENTIFTITNTGNLPQVAHVTLWTDWSYPVLDFNLFLTGYDVQSINLYDVIRRGRIAPDHGTGFDVSPVGELSGDTVLQRTLDNPLVDEDDCVDLPVQIPQAYIARMQSAFTTGKVPALGGSPACNTAGGIHPNAVGYVTIDVTGSCSTSLPTDAGYFTDVIGFDNVLGGDYLQINGNEDFAQAGPMVHIRAIPEGGTPQTRAGNDDYAVNAVRTFYSRYQHAARPKADARQPLPSVFSARWISGGATGFETFFKIWREGRGTPSAVCSSYPAQNGTIGIADLVRFDEEENPETLAPDLVVTPIANAPVLPAASLIHADNYTVFPDSTTNTVAGWMYLNLDASQADEYANQSWVVSSMRAEDRFSVDIDAMALGNGCSMPIGRSEAFGGTAIIGPLPNARP